MLWKTFACLCLLAAAVSPNAWADDAVPAGNAPTFERDVRPILRAHCLDCHGATEKHKGGLDLRLARFLIQGGDSGGAIVPGKPGESLLMERVRAGEMPPGDSKLKPHEISVLERWIEAGARTARAEPETIPPGLGITPEERDWWAFHSVRRPDVPPQPAAAHADRCAAVESDAGRNVVLRRRRTACVDAACVHRPDRPAAVSGTG